MLKSVVKELKSGIYGKDPINSTIYGKDPELVSDCTTISCTIPRKNEFNDRLSMPVEMTAI
jgi:hypothetical protein